MTVSDLPVEGPRLWPGTSDHQFDLAGVTEAHRHWRCRGRSLDQELGATETSTSISSPSLRTCRAVL